ncbi:MAG: fused MFS/spermidine synthase [Micavibrio aeruginosavorus]|uniref:Fused MFS/spermidine synthase n=1 Tax=Micavibrio aeruginosavorus TaxID=349221 RepID=A0A7T5R106_9BACT|nr:MAG: fused MFS/spermidine synthase [Micavibrio aeruginosavorus]
MVLPLLGGTPAVWNTAMMFFQVMLLGGYAYAHLTSKYLGIRAQALLHLGLLGLCLLALPIAIPQGWSAPPVTDNPMPWLLGMMTAAIGGPFFVIAGTAPMLQRWFSATDHPDAHNPYFLYAASNFGSMTALIFYPLLIEPLLGVQQQSQIWMMGYLLLALLIAITGFVSRHSRALPAAIADTRLPANSMTPTNRMRVIWLALSFIPSSLMLGVTTYITTDIAAVPLLWVVPLALYLLTFIIVFSRGCTLSLARTYRWQALSLILVALLFIRDPLKVKAIAASLHLIAFFLCALTCHLALAHRRPTPHHLTEFYLFISLGGVLGGVFNSLLAPLIFVIPLEYALILGLSVLAPFISGDMKFNPQDLRKDCKPALTAIILSGIALMPTKSAAIMIMVMAGIGVALVKLSRRASCTFACVFLIVLTLDPGFDWYQLGRSLHMERNFFGVIRVTSSEKGGMRMLLHGTTLHGTQALDETYRLSPISYYAAGSPGGQVFGMLSDIRGHEPQSVAMLGLGVGSTACFFEKGRDFIFYEIDPAMKRIAEDKNLFTYLSDCGSPYRIVMGDGRLRIAEAPDASYDMIFLDAFSSDSIPMHLLTKEAFDIYFRKLKPKGLIVIHISNRFLDLSPVVTALGKAMNAQTRFSYNLGRLLAPPDIVMQGSIFGVMTRNPDLLAIIDERYTKWEPYSGIEIPVWTDDYANIITPLLLRITKEPNWMSP